MNEIARRLGLAVGTTVVTMAVALLMVRWLAPGLLGLPTDLRLVQVDEEVAPFLDGVFRRADYESGDFLLPDPYLINRAKPLLDDYLVAGPHDILGFRNRAVPNVADVITIGGSQTYGNNAPLEESWPSRLSAHVGRGAPTIYNISCGAWSGPQYLEAFEKALYFRPRVVVAFYSGNDPVGAFTAAYGSEHWSDLRPDPTLSPDDALPVSFPAPPSKLWPVGFADRT